MLFQTLAQSEAWVLTKPLCVQELLLRSSQPIAALEMRQDLKHWPEALALAQRLAPDRLPNLSKEHAAMLEMVGEFAEACSHYKQASTKCRVLLTAQAPGAHHAA